MMKFVLNIMKLETKMFCYMRISKFLLVLIVT
jgi:hypothetical protein